MDRGGETMLLLMVQNTCEPAKLGSSSNIPIYVFFQKMHHHVETSCIAGIFQTNGEGYPMAQKVSKKTKQNDNSKQTSIEEDKLSSREGKLTYPTKRVGKSSTQKCRLVVSRRVTINHQANPPMEGRLKAIIQASSR